VNKRLNDLRSDIHAGFNHVYDLIVNKHAMPTLRAEYAKPADTIICTPGKSPVSCLLSPVSCLLSPVSCHGRRLSALSWVPCSCQCAVLERLGCCCGCASDVGGRVCV
jgi:hypothetical protein